MLKEKLPETEQIRVGSARREKPDQGWKCDESKNGLCGFLSTSDGREALETGRHNTT